MSQEVSLPATLAKEYVLKAKAQELTGLGRTAFNNYRKMGVFRGRRWKRYVLILKADVDRFLKNLPVA